MRIIPPNLSAQLPINKPILFPRNNPMADKSKHITPIIIEGNRIGTWRAARLKPTAAASILVAIEKKTNVNPLEGSFLIGSFLLV